MQPRKPDLKLFRQFVSSSELSVLKRMSVIINQRILSLQDASFSDQPVIKETGYSKASIALDELWKEDWSYLFAQGDVESEDFYVYMHINPKSRSVRYQADEWSMETRLPFYIGKGRGDRVFCKKRSRMHEQRINALVKAGHTPESFMQYHRTGLTEAAAKEIESKLILFFGIRTALPSSSQKSKARMLSGFIPVLLNQQYEPFPEKYDHYAYNGLSRSEALSLAAAHC